MPNKILLAEQDGTPKQIVFADHATDFSPATAVDLRLTTDGSNELDVQMDLTSLGDGAARQSAKFDFGADRAAEYHIRAALEFASSGLTAGEIVEIYMGYSQTVTPANGNPGGLTGSDAAYAGYSANLADSVYQLERIGDFVVTGQATGTVQKAECGIFQPKARYGILVLKNESGAALHSDAVESHITLDPIVPEVQ